MAYVVVIGEEPRVRGLVQQILARAGHEVEAMNSGAAALEAAARRPPELLVVDLPAPGEGNLKAAAALRERLPTVPALVLLSSAPAGELVAPALPVLGKPFRPFELVRAVQELLAERQGRKDGPARCKGRAEG